MINFVAKFTFLIWIVEPFLWFHFFVVSKRLPSGRV